MILFIILYFIQAIIVYSYFYWVYTSEDISVDDGFETDFDIPYSMFMVMVMCPVINTVATIGILVIIISKLIYKSFH